MPGRLYRSGRWLGIGASLLVLSVVLAWAPPEAHAGTIVTLTGSKGPEPADQPASGYTATRTVRVAVQLTGSSVSHEQYKVWNDGEAKPVAWSNIPEPSGDVFTFNHLLVDGYGNRAVSVETRIAPPSIDVPESAVPRSTSTKRHPCCPARWSCRGINPASRMTPVSSTTNRASSTATGGSASSSPSTRSRYLVGTRDEQGGIICTFIMSSLFNNLIP